MIKITMSELGEIARKTREIIAEARDFEFKDYHGFLKARLPKEILSEVVKDLGVAINDIQAEIVVVNRDLSNEIHMHEESSAYCIVLGINEGFPDAKGSLVFINNEWKGVASNQEIRIPQKTFHGFTTKNGGSLTFLSVQYPPIEREGGDDYYKLR
jgi:hypothetical protein